MNLLICGSRKINLTTDEVDCIVRLSKFSGYTHLCCGMANGVDISALRWADERNIPVVENPYIEDGGTGIGGHIRNQRMVDISDFWIGVIDTDWTKGTLDCYKRAKKKGIPTFVYNVGSQSLL